MPRKSLADRPLVARAARCHVARAMRVRPLLVIAALLACAAPAAAADGTFTHVLCANPNTGEGVMAGDGRLPDGATNPHNMQWAGVSAEMSRCTGTIDGSRGVPVTTGAAWATSESNRGSALRYRAPAELAFAGGVIYRYGTMSGRFSWTVTRNGRWDYIFGTPSDERCTWGDGCYSRGTPTAPWSEANRVNIAAGTPEVNGFDLSVLCDVPSGRECQADGSQTVRVYGGRLALADRAAPEPGPASGPLVTASQLAGTADLEFSAADTGPGLYRVHVFVDGTQRLVVPVHANDGRCIDVDGSNGDAYEFAWQQPCRSRASVATTFDTRTVPDGEVALKVLVEDAAGNAAAIVNRRVEIDNVPPGGGTGGGGSGGGGGGSGGGAGGGTGTGAGGAAGANGAPGAPGAASSGSLNGEGASPRARLSVAFRGRSASVRTVSYGRAATATGRLVDEQGRPIAGAIIDVTSTARVRRATPTPAPPAVTRPDGTFRYRVDGRAASRTLRFTYRWQRGGAVAAEESLILRVRATVKLAVRLRGIVVRYSGRVRSGPLPRGGKLVVLQGRARGGRWQTFASRRATRAGRFRGAYRLKVRRPGVRLQFRARAVAEAGWPYLAGTSRVVTRRVR